jgi:hypothetical protein
VNALQALTACSKQQAKLIFPNVLDKGNELLGPLKKEIGNENKIKRALPGVLDAVAAHGGRALKKM